MNAVGCVPEIKAKIGRQRIGRSVEMSQLGRQVIGSNIQAAVKDFHAPEVLIESPTETSAETAQGSLQPDGSLTLLADDQVPAIIAVNAKQLGSAVLINRG